MFIGQIFTQNLNIEGIYMRGALRHQEPLDPQKGRSKSLVQEIQAQIITIQD